MPDDIYEEAADDLEEVKTPDDQKDIFWALTKPLDKMTLEEQMEALRRIREMRNVRIAPMKQKSELDQILSQLSPERAASLLKQLRELEAAAKKEGEEKEKK